jgi:L-lysine 6-transaminase
MVRAQKFLEIIEEENLVENARDRGKALLSGLQELEARHEGVTQARGRGLMAAFDLPRPELRDKVLATARDHGVLALASGTHSVRFRPTLTVTDEVIRKGIEILDSAIKDAL